MSALRYRVTLLVFHLFVLLTPSTSFAVICEKLFKVIEANEYEVDRYFADYAYILGPSFIKKYQGLNKDDHWIDAGAGNLNPVIQHFTGKIVLMDEQVGRIADWTAERQLGNNDAKDFQKFIDWFRSDERRQTPKTQANVTAISYAVDDSSGKWLFEGKGGRQGDYPKEKFQLWEGKFFEEIPARDLTSRFGKAEIITDVFGVMSYTDQPTKTLKHYLSSLESDGSIFIVVGRGKDKNGMHRETVKVGRRTMTMLDWLKANKTIEVEVSKTPYRFPGYPLPKFSVVEIRKKGVTPKVPNLVLEGTPYGTASPPIRTFRQVD